MAQSRPAHPIVVKATTAAQLLEVSRAQVYNLMARGDLRRITIGHSKSVRIPIEDVYALAGREYPGGDAA